MKYLVTRISNNKQELVECFNCTPNQEIFSNILIAPRELDHPNDCDIADNIVTINPTKKAARLQVEADTKAAQGAIVLAEKQKLDEIKAEIKSLKEDAKQIKKIDDLLPILDKLFQRLDEIATRLL